MTSDDSWLNKIPIPNDDVAWRMVDDEAIIIEPMTSQATVLNPVAARLWELADGKRAVAELIDTIVVEYDVKPAVAEEDAREFFGVLAKRGLLSYRDAAE